MGLGDLGEEFCGLRFCVLTYCPKQEMRFSIQEIEFLYFVLPSGGDPSDIVSPLQVSIDHGLALPCNYIQPRDGGRQDATSFHWILSPDGVTNRSARAFVRSPLPSVRNSASRIQLARTSWLVRGGCVRASELAGRRGAKEASKPNPRHTKNQDSCRRRVEVAGAISYRSVIGQSRPLRFLLLS